MRHVLLWVLCAVFTSLVHASGASLFPGAVLRPCWLLLLEHDNLTLFPQEGNTVAAMMSRDHNRGSACAGPRTMPVETLSRIAQSCYILVVADIKI
jgi:hypothetical protein